MSDVDGLTLDDRARTELIENRYLDLTPAQKALVDPAAVDKLNAAVDRITQLSLEELDATIIAAVAGLTYSGTGISGIVYEYGTATFYVADPNEKAYRFSGSGVMNVFTAMFQAVTKMTLYGPDETIYEGLVVDPDDPFAAAVKIVAVMAGIELRPEGIDPDEMMAVTLQDLMDAGSMRIDVVIHPNNKDYVGEFTIVFTAAQE